MYLNKELKGQGLKRGDLTLTLDVFKYIINNGAKDNVRYLTLTLDVFK